MKLKAQKRDSSTPRLRRAGEKNKKEKDVVLGIIYGSVKDNISVVCKLRDFEKVYTESGSSGIVELDVDGKSYDVIVKDIQLDNVSGDYYHIDFYAITQDQEIEANVAFEFIGEHSAEKVGGLLNISLTETHIKALPKNLPKSIVIDLAELKEIGDSIRLADIKLPEGAKFIDGLDMETSIISIVTARSVEDAEEANAGEVEIEPEEGEEVEGEEEGDKKEEKASEEEEKPEEKKDVQDNS